MATGMPVSAYLQKDDVVRTGGGEQPIPGEDRDRKSLQSEHATCEAGRDLGEHFDA